MPVLYVQRGMHVHVGLLQVAVCVQRYHDACSSTALPPCAAFVASCDPLTLELDVQLAVNELISLQDFTKTTPAVLILVLWVSLAEGQVVIVVCLLQVRSSHSDRV